MQKQDKTALLRELKTPKTARSLASRLGCALPTVYARLAELAKEVSLETSVSDEVKPGPKATLFRITRGA